MKQNSAVMKLDCSSAHSYYQLLSISRLIEKPARSLVAFFSPGPVEEQPDRRPAQSPASSRAAALPQPPLCPEFGKGSSGLYGQIKPSSHGCHFQGGRAIIYSYF